MLESWFCITPDRLQGRTVLLARRSGSDTGYWVATSPTFPAETEDGIRLLEPKLIADQEILQLAKLHPEVDNLYFMLKRLQWLPGEWEQKQCPACMAGEKDGHFEGCEIARLLDVFGPEL